MPYSDLNNLKTSFVNPLKIDDPLMQKFPQIFDASACDDMIRLQIAGVTKDKREEIMINGIRSAESPLYYHYFI